MGWPCGLAMSTNMASPRLERRHRIPLRRRWRGAHDPGASLREEHRSTDRRGRGNPGPVLASLAVFAATLAVGLMASPSSATVPGDNGKIALTTDRHGNQKIYMMNADGSWAGPKLGGPRPRCAR